VSARDRILAAAQVASRERHTHPGTFRPSPAAASWDAFRSALESIEAEAPGPVSRAELPDLVRSVATRFGAGRCVAEPAALEILGAGPWESAAEANSPHDFQDVDVGVALGALGVAENGAVVVTGDLAPDRALLLLCERLILLVDAARVVPDMHAAVARLGPEAARHHHTTWIAGPSKTADIAQVLVVGAHGPRELAVIGYRAADSSP
jgi:L-lactate dehydrogenase complex protein LldG